jgi:AcrR family transcriptional regulator
MLLLIEHLVNGVRMPGQKATEVERRQQIVLAAYRVASMRGLESLTIRAVAMQAGLSHGLVHFHFKKKADLLDSLLEWLLAKTAALQTGPEITQLGSPLMRFQALLRQEMERVGRDRAAIHLFFDFWLAGTRDRRIRRRMKTELDRYRAAFRPMAEEVLLADPVRFAHVTAEGLASVAVAFIKGCALQSVLDPKGFDIALFTTAAGALMDQLEYSHGR